MTAQVEGLFPVDPNLVPPENRIALDTTLHATAEKGKVEVIYHFEKQEIITNVSK